MLFSEPVPPSELGSPTELVPSSEKASPAELVTYSELVPHSELVRSYYSEQPSELFYTCVSPGSGHSNVLFSRHLLWVPSSEQVK